MDSARQQVAGPLTEASDRMMEALGRVIQFVSEGAYAGTERTSKAAGEAYTVIITALVIIVIALADLATVLTRSIVVPLADRREGAERGAPVDLSRDIQGQGRGQAPPPSRASGREHA